MRIFISCILSLVLLNSFGCDDNDDKNNSNTGNSNNANNLNNITTTNNLNNTNNINNINNTNNTTICDPVCEGNTTCENQEGSLVCVCSSPFQEHEGECLLVDTLNLIIHPWFQQSALNSLQQVEQ